MTWQKAWAIGSEDTPVESGRLVAYCASGGYSGVVGPGDCQVREMPSPTSLVRIMRGAVVIASRYASANQQSYAARNPSEDTVSISATGGASRSDLVVVRVRDDQYPGVSQAATETYVVEDVDASTGSVEDAIAQGKTGLEAAYALARLDIPSATSTITQSMVTDLREIAQPKTATKVLSLSQENGADPENLTDDSYVTWPSWTDTGIQVPPWAVRGNFVAILSGVGIWGHNDNNTWGKIRIKFADTAGAATYYNNHLVAAGSGESRDSCTLVTGGDLYVPASARGTRATLHIEGLQDGGSAYLQSLWGTTYSLSVSWFQTVDEQYW